MWLGGIPLGVTVGDPFKKPPGKYRRCHRLATTAAAAALFVASVRHVRTHEVTQHGTGRRSAVVLLQARGLVEISKSY